MQLVQGETVAGKYRLDRKIGAGGMGEVWSAVQIPTRKSVALKFLRGAESDPDTKRRFLREARAACAVRHPNVVVVHDVIELEDGAPVMVMELLRGESLEDRLRREGRLSVGDLAGVIARVVSAVGTAHALGIVHRDLKPDNIFLAETPDGVDVKVLDFGIAKLTALDGDAAQTGGLTSTGAMLGTPFYMSPEQAFGEKKIDHRADIWSLGIILYRGLSGILPTRADNIGQILKIIMTHAIPPLGDVAPGAPPEIVELVGRMLQQSPAARPADLREVGEVLARHAGVAVDPFSAPASRLDVGAVSSPSFESRIADRPTLGLAADRPATLGGDTARGTAHSQTGVPAKRRTATTVLVAAAAVAVTAVVVVSLRRPASVAGAASPDAPSAAPAPSPAAPPNASPPEASAPASTEPTNVAPSASASASPATSTAAQPAAPARGAAGRAAAGRVLPSAAPSAAPAAPRSTSVGGVVTNPPF